MAIVEQPVIEHLTFQVYNGTQWQPLDDKATSIDIKRGGSQSGAAPKISAGTLDATLFGKINLALTPLLKPNAPIRVVRNQDFKFMWQSTTLTYNSRPTWPHQMVNLGGTDNTRFVRIQQYDAATATNLPSDYLFLTSVTPIPVDEYADNIAAGQSYTLNVQVQDEANAIIRNDLRLVIFTGTPANPTIVARSLPRAYSTVATGLSLPFVAASEPMYIGYQLVGPVLADAQPTNTLLRGVVIYNNVVNVSRPAGGTPEFTGIINDIYQTVDYDKANDIKHVYTTILAVDAVQELGNITRSGVVSTSGLGYQDWPARIDQLHTSAVRAKWVYPASGDVTRYRYTGQNIDGWSGSSYNTTGSGNTITGSTAYASGNIRTKAESKPNAGGWSFVLFQAATFTGLTPGAIYRFEANLAVSGGTRVANFGTIAPFSVPSSLYSTVTTNSYNWGENTNFQGVGDSTRIAIEFRASDPSMVVGWRTTNNAQFTGDTGASLIQYDMSGMLLTLSGDPQGFRLQDVAYETDLANHLDLACNTVGASWWVDKSNIVRFRRESDVRAEKGLYFVDKASGSWAADMHYTDIAFSYDTRNVVNSLKFNQHGYARATGNTDDESVAFSNVTSQLRWGVKNAELDTSMYTGGIHSEDLARRASLIFGDLRRPNYAASSITWNAQENPEALAWIDVHAKVHVHYEAHEQQSRIIGIRHKIDPYRWEVTLDLAETATGRSFAEFVESSGGTFTSMNNYLGTASFDTANVGVFN